MSIALRRAVLRCGLLTVLMAGSMLIAQDQTADKKGETKPAAPARKAQNRLPTNYRKLNLSEDQTKKIYDIQASYDPKISELKAQLKLLEDKEQSDVEAILTPEQLKQLTTIREESKKKKAEDAKAKANAKKSGTAVAEPAKPEPAKKPDGEKKPEADKKPADKKP